MIQGLLGSLSVLLLTLVFLQVPGYSAPVEPLSPEAAVAMRTFPLQAPISLSADGNWVAFTLQQGAPRAEGSASGTEAFYGTGITWLAGGAEVWVANTRTHEQFEISDRSSSSWSPVWSPNGKFLAFYSDSGGVAHLWVWDLLKRTSRLIGHLQIRAFALNETPKWSQDNRFVFAKTLAQGPAKSSSGALSRSATIPRVFRSGSAAGNKDREKVDSAGEIASADEGYRGDLCRFDLQTTKIDCLVRGKAIVGWWVSPSGRYLAVSEVDGLEGGNADLRTYSLWIVDLVTNRAEALSNRIPLLILGLAVSWSPDGKKLAYVVGGDPNYSEPLVQCFVIEVENRSAPLKLTAEVRPAAADVFSPPRWTQDSTRILLMDSEGVYVYSVAGNRPQVLRPAAGRSFLALLASRSDANVWSRGGPDIYAFEEDETRLDVELYRMSLADGSGTRLSGEAIALSTYPSLQIDVSADGSTAVYLAQASDQPLDVWAADAGFMHHWRTSTTNPQLANQKFGKSRLISWRNVDGVELHGAVLVPPDFENTSPCPLVVDVYGGEKQSHYLNAFGLAGSGGVANHQWLATRGIAVFLPDAPMGTVTPALDLLKSVMPGVERMVELGIARSDAIAVKGESYGGYSVLSLLMQTGRFKAAIAVAPVADLFDMYSIMNDTGESEWISWAEQSQGRMAGTPWQYRDKYIDNSPFFFADRIDTPVLIVAGAADESATRNSRRMFVALRRLGKTAEYVEYPDARHVPELWFRDQQLDFIRRTIAWFEYYLTSTSTPTQRP